MELSFENIMAFVRTNFFYDFRSSVLTICVLFCTFFFFKLLKDNGEKVIKSMRYLTCLVIFFAIAALVY